MSQLIEVRQTPDQSAISLGLDKYNKSKFPKTFEVIQPAKTPDGRWVTGLDEHAVSVKSIADPIRRQERIEEIKELREELERLTGLDLSGTSNYWDNFYLKIVDKLPLNFDNPLDKVKYYVLIANNFAAPELEARHDENYINSKFYIHRAESEDSQKAVKTRERDKAVSDLYQMFENRDKLILIGRYVLGTKVKESMKSESIYNLLRDAINDDKEGTVVRKLNEATSKTVEELQYKLTFDEAVAKHVIRLRDGYYQRGNATYGKTAKEVIKFLSSPENANEFASIKEEVEEKRALG